jgi:hypothetical protein
MRRLVPSEPLSLTPRLDLRGGRNCWSDNATPQILADASPTAPVDVAIIGAGVTGAILADRAAALLQQALSEAPHPLAAAFAPDRFATKTGGGTASAGHRPQTPSGDEAH